MRYESLENEDIKNIHRVFVDAFSKYEVKIDMPIEKLSEMLVARSYRGDYSIGCYDNGNLVGFVLTGYRESTKTKLGYDIATGITRAYQDRGIGSEIVNVLLESLKNKNIDKFILEVLENNIPAQKVYTRNGFTIDRRLCCYSLHKDSGQTPRGTIEPAGKSMDTSVDEAAYCSFKPSWQNSLASYMNVREKYQTVLKYDDQGGLSGYGIIHKESGSILQVGSKESPSRENVVSEIINDLTAVIKKEKYTILNIEDGSWMSRLLPALGFINDMNQYEMSYTFKP